MIPGVTSTGVDTSFGFEAGILASLVLGVVLLCVVPVEAGGLTGVLTCEEPEEVLSLLVVLFEELSTPVELPVPEFPDVLEPLPEVSD